VKVELALFDTDSRVWRGLVKIEGELFKVHLFPGSATKEWEAVLLTGAFVECTPNNPLTIAIEKAFEDYINLRQPLTRSEIDSLVELVNDKPEILEEIKKALEGGKRE